MPGGDQAANIYGHDNIVVQANGSGIDVTVVHGTPHLRLTHYARRTALAARSGAQTALLSAYRDDVTPLLGRERELAELRAWLDKSDAISLRVLTGGAGRGKTRLARELACAVMPEWLGGFLTTGELARFRHDGRTEEWRWDKPALILIDYPASRVEALKDWLKEMVDADLDGRPKLRLLLLERQAQREIGWLADLIGRGEDEESLAKAGWLDPPKPVELEPLEGLAHRRELFATLLKRADPAMAAPEIGADGEFDRALGERKWGGDPLFLMMAGLVAAKAGVSKALSLSRADLALNMADVELKRIGRFGAAGGDDGKVSAEGRCLRRTAALATLTQGGTAAEARALAQGECAAMAAAVDLDAVVRALGEALPPIEAGRAVGPILPDIVGEAALLRVFGDGGEGVRGGVEALPRILAAARGAVKGASATLVRTAQDFAAAGRLEPIRWLEAWAEAPETEPGVLMQIADALPEQTLALRETAARLHGRICAYLTGLEVASPSPEVEALRAAALNNLGNCLSDLGRREEALAATGEAVEIRRRLAADRPDAFLPNLAMSLNNLGNRLSDLGRREEALAAAGGAVEIRRCLAADRPDAFLPVLAASLNNLGNCLNDLGRREEALAAAGEAVEIYRRLAADGLDAFLPDLAMSLNNLGAFLSVLGRREEALAAAGEAVEIYRRLAADRPDAFLPDLAASLNNLGNRLSDLGRRKEALAAAGEAVEIYRSLAAERPDAFLPVLAASLNNLGNRLNKLGRREEALAAAGEAVEIRRRLAADRPDAFLPNLAMSLNNLGNRLSDLGRREEALAAAGETVEIYRRLAADRPDAFMPVLATSLNNLGAFLGDLGRREEALAAAGEAVEIRRRLAADRPDAFLPDLAGSLGTLGNCLEALGRMEDACDAIREAVETLAPAFLKLPLAHGRWMFMMRQQYLARCEALDRPPDAALLAPIDAALQTLQDPNPEPP